MFFSMPYFKYLNVPILLTSWTDLVFISSVVVNGSHYENQKALDMQTTQVFLD